VPLSFLLAGLVLAVNVSPARAQGPAATSPFYPLKVGTTWQYRLGSEKLTVKVAGEEKVGDLACARVEAVYKGKTSTEYVAVQPDGLYRAKMDDAVLKPALCFLQLPPQKGKTWKVNSEVDGVKIKGTFIQDEEEITVPAGTFKAVKVSSKDYTIGGRTMTLTYWFAEGKGIVKQRLEMDGYDWILELEAFQPGP
jgi:hypothetical protein